MKQTFTFIVLLFISIILFSCRAKKENSVLNNPNIYELDFKHNDYSKSANEALKVLKEEISRNNFDEVDIKIINVHNGRYTIDSNIQRLEKHLIIKTIESTMSGENKEKKNMIYLDHFITKLDSLIAKSENEIVFAGTYQIIILNIKGKTSRYNTRKAFGLMNIL